MNEEQLEELLARGHEATGVEFKGADPRTDTLLQAKVVRAAMGMSNLRDGGFVIIGVKEENSVLSAIGLTNEQLGTWRHDDTATTFSSYADPSIEFETDVLSYKGTKLVVLHIQQFRESPVLCKKQLSVAGRQELREGACYVRSRRKPETSEVSTQEDMRDLLDLALDRALRKWVGQAQKAGLLSPAAPPSPTDRQRFEGQLSGL